MDTDAAPPYDTLPASEAPSSRAHGRSGTPDRRRGGPDRRRHLWRSLVLGSMRPRRRTGRRASDHDRPIIDMHGPALLASATLLLALCVTDAALTLSLISLGAVEANPFMALFTDGNVTRFVLTKVTLTGAGVLLLVGLSRFRVFRVLRVESILHAFTCSYVLLIAYELALVARLA
jgi:hypothetical protein